MTDTANNTPNPDVRDKLQALAVRESLLTEVVLLIAKTPDLDKLLSGVTAMLERAIGFERCTVALLSADAKTYQLRTLLETRDGFGSDILERVPVGEGIAGAVIRSGEMVVSQDFASVKEKSLPIDDAMEGGSIRSILSLPFVAYGKVLGAITFGRSVEQPFNVQHIDLIKIIVVHLALAVDRWCQARVLKESKERYTLALNAINDRLWDWDLRSNELYISPRVKELLGLPPGDMRVTTQEWQARNHPEDISIFRNGMRAYLRGETSSFREEFRVKDRTGAFRWVLHQGFGLRDENARVYRMAGLMGDISERKNAELELLAAKQRVEEANRIKDAFLADLSHSLRIPLNSIIGYSEILAEEIDDLGDAGKRLNPDLAKIETAGRDMLDVIDTILDHFKIESGLVEVNYETFDIEELIVDIGTSAGPLIEEKGNRLEITLDTNLGSMHSDLTKVRRAVFNLLSHIAKFAENTTIMLSASRAHHPDGDTISIKVARADVNTISQQIEGAARAVTQADTDQYGSPGLGMTVSQYYCELLGGEIAFSVDPAYGNIAVVTLPALVGQSPVSKS